MRALRLWIAVILLICAGALAGCEALGLGEGASGGGAGACSEPAAGMQTIRAPKHGYCLAYPAIYQVEPSSETEIVFYQGSLLDVQHARLSIQVEEADGRTAKKAADALLKEFEGMGMDIARSEIKLGGATATQLDGVPGQDLGRVVFVVKGKRLYKLTFTPDDPAEAARYAELQALYQAVAASWAFVNE